MGKILRALTMAMNVAILYSVLAGSVAAQPSFELGIKAGLGVTSLKGDDTTASESGRIELGGGAYALGDLAVSIDDTKPGFVGGLYATVHINPRFAIRLEGLYSQKGGKGKNMGSLTFIDTTIGPPVTVSVSGENTVTLDYFEIPLLGVVSFPISPTGTFDVFAGVALAFNTKAEIEREVILSATGITVTETIEEDLGDSTESTDFGGVLGGGVTFKLEHVVIFGEARWTYGFRKIDKDGDIKNNAISFIVGLGIPLAKSPQQSF